jgi:hypothetical protein
MSAGRREAEASVRALQGEVEQSRTECVFYQTSHTDTAALLRARDQEVSALERDLAKAVAKREALEGQVVDKEEVSARDNITQHNTALHNTALHNTTQQGTSQHNTTQHGTI